MSARKYAPQIGFLFLLALSRLGVHALGIAPDPAIVIDHWQNVDLRFLASDPIGSLWALHAQPPIWNAILAIAAGIVGPDGDAVTALMYAFNLVLTAGAGLLVMSMLRSLQFPPVAAAAFALAAMCSPNVIYFETIVFYPHLTFFLITLLAWLLFRVKRGRPLWPVLSAIGLVTALSWTWAIFHPVFVGAFAAGMVVWHGGWKWPVRPVLGAAAVLAFGVSTLPSIKNYVTWGIPSASTWIGLNLAQTVPGGQTGEFIACDFETAHKAAVAAQTAAPQLHPLLTQDWKRPTAPNMNNIGMIPISKRCFEMTKAVMLADPLAWIGARIDALAGSHQLAPSNYNADPLGWDAVMGPVERATADLGFISRSAMTFWYLALLLIAVKNIRTNPPLYLSLLGVVAYFTLASHLMNGGEQARMRYTIEPIYLLFSALLLLAAARLPRPAWLGAPVKEQA